MNAVKTLRKNSIKEINPNAAKVTEEQKLNFKFSLQQIIAEFETLS